MGRCIAWMQNVTYKVKTVSLRSVQYDQEIVIFIHIILMLTQILTLILTETLILIPHLTRIKICAVRNPVLEFHKFA